MLSFASHSERLPSFYSVPPSTEGGTEAFSCCAPSPAPSPPAAPAAAPGCPQQSPRRRGSVPSSGRSTSSCSCSSEGGDEPEAESAMPQPMLSLEHCAPAPRSPSPPSAAGFLRPASPGPGAPPGCSGRRSSHDSNMSWGAGTVPMLRLKLAQDSSGGIVSPDPQLDAGPAPCCAPPEPCSIGSDSSNSGAAAPPARRRPTLRLEPPAEDGQRGALRVTLASSASPHKESPAGIISPTTSSPVTPAAALRTPVVPPLRLPAWGGDTARAIESECDEIVRSFSSRTSLVTAGGKSARLAERWQPDEAADRCTKCTAKFTLTRRRHHCRACGYIFCSACSQHKFTIPESTKCTAERVCIFCFGNLQQRVLAALPGSAHTSRASSPRARAGSRSARSARGSARGSFTTPQRPSSACSS
eukprot:TRINITY_DN17923_c0_g1_i1.p1 TRINITY_DN17923_c0_g1~~TRINITY_DN17923_c0_g1_i1.p1  ORF type:complete len:415 (+),score=82.15 TRINITY_DN17923_c0_g1_i1:78-1322(+)